MAIAFGNPDRISQRKGTLTDKRIELDVVDFRVQNVEQSTTSGGDSLSDSTPSVDVNLSSPTPSDLKARLIARLIARLVASLHSDQK